MPRGGKRSGAGRPTGSAVLTADEQIIVAVECDRRWRADYEGRLKAAQDEYFSKSDYHEQAARVRASRGRDSEALEDVEFARREMAGIDAADEADAPRLVSFRVSRPYGKKALIIDEVAAWATERFSKRVTAGLVRSAWNILRQVEADDV